MIWFYKANLTFSAAHGLFPTDQIAGSFSCLSETVPYLVHPSIINGEPSITLITLEFAVRPRKRSLKTHTNAHKIIYNCFTYRVQNAASFWKYNYRNFGNHFFPIIITETIFQSKSLRSSRKQISPTTCSFQTRKASAYPNVLKINQLLKSEQCGLTDWRLK